MEAFRYRAREEIAHAVTHGVGALLAIAALSLLVTYAAIAGGAARVVSAAVFGAALVATYTASTVYHAIPAAWDRAKRALRRLDHCMIYLLIAGTYTPFTLVTLEGAWGWSLFGVVWGLALLGVVAKLTPLARYEKLSLASYLATGWLVVVALRPLVEALPAGALALVVLGGVAYTLGTIFYAWERLPYHHAIWHLFVLAGSTLHFFAVLLYVVA